MRTRSEKRVRYQADWMTEIPVGRLGRPEEVAETVLWMVKTSYVTNKVIGVDGGMFPQ
jgi:3-oxoacyl-[acyl-carrier protein] reductase